MGVTVNAGKAIRYLSGMGRRLSLPKPALKRVGEYVMGLSQQAFKDSENPATHKKWKALEDVTIELRKNKGREGTEILIDSSDLRDSVHKLITGKNKVAVGTNKVYGAMHQYGGTTSPRSMIPGKKIPARPYLGIDKPGFTEIHNIVKRYIVEGRK